MNLIDRSRHHDLQQSILATLAYSDHFCFPLTRTEIFSRLISSIKFSQAKVYSEIQQLIHRKIIIQTGRYIHLKGRSSLVSLREKKRSLSISQFSSAKDLANKVKIIPGIMAIYLTGSLAMSNADAESDIDFMIIAKPGRLWSTRLLLTIFTTITGLRRTPSSTSNAGKLCLNLYLTPDSYLLPESKRSIYTAYELIQAIPLYDPINTHNDLLASNPWISTYLANFELPEPTSVLKPQSRDLRGIECLLYILQRAYMRSKLTREYITPNSAFFHPNNPGISVQKKLESSRYN